MSWTARPGPGALAWGETLRPTARIDCGGGTASDLILDPSLDTTVVSGGAFASIAPRVGIEGALTPATRLRLSLQGTLERYFNADERWLGSQSLGATLVHTGPRSSWWRLSAGQDFFDDSQRETVRRLGGWTEVGVGTAVGSAAFELAGNLGGRRYPQLFAPDDSGVLDTYDDWSRGLRATGLVALGEHVWAQVRAERSETYARDPLFDSGSWLHAVTLGTRAGSVVEIGAAAMWQRRTFPTRVPAEDDEYLLVDLRASLALRGRARLLAQAGFYRYTWPDGAADEGHHFLVGLRFIWGDATVARVSPDLRWPEQPPHLTRLDGQVVFRIHAPRASQVNLVGDFNAWDPLAQAMRKTGEGWWELAVSLAPGMYQYGYVVDGSWTPPPDAELLIDDGFGGHNGLVEVPPWP